MKLATWNVNSLKVRLPHLTDWLAQAQPDIVCLQELKTRGREISARRTAGGGLPGRVLRTENLQRRRDPLAPRRCSTSAREFPGSRTSKSASSPPRSASVRVVCVYCPNGQAVGSDKYAYKLRWFAALKDYLAAELQRHPQLAVAGDFNVAPEDRDVHDPEGLGRPGPRLRAGARRLARAARPRPEGHASACSSSRKKSIPGGITG